MSGNIKQSGNYILITPCKNEEDNLFSLINSITCQTINPIVWVIIDDGSTDNTPTILADAKNKYSWIKVLRLEEKPRDIGLHLAEVMKKGFDYAISFCKQTSISYEYLGNVDGDLILPESFFENLIKEFENNTNLGIASGGTDNIIHGKKVRAILSENEPSGGHMLIRRKCFEDCKGFPISYSADSVIKAKARLRGWATKRFEKNIATEIRDVNSAEGYWKGLMQSGKSSYYLNFHPFHVILKSIKYSSRKPYYGGFAFFVGYLGSFIRRRKRINDKEIQKYFWNKWMEHI